MTQKKASRRGRPNKPKNVSDKEWVSLIKFNSRALRLRQLAGITLSLLQKKHGSEFYKTLNLPEVDDESATLHYDMTMFIEYWHSALELVVQAYEEYALFDDKVEVLLNMPIRDKLMYLRNNSYHFRKDFDDPKVFSLFQTEGSFEWVNSLQNSLSDFLGKEQAKLYERSGISLRKIQGFIR